MFILVHMTVSSVSLTHTLYFLFVCPTAPSVVPIMHQVGSTSRSFSLSWPPPEQPNGIILDYEIRYYDKVGLDDERLCVFVRAPSSFCHRGHSQESIPSMMKSMSSTSESFVIHGFRRAVIIGCRSGFIHCTQLLWMSESKVR